MLLFRSLTVADVTFESSSDIEEFLKELDDRMVNCWQEAEDEVKVMIGDIPHSVFIGWHVLLLDSVAIATYSPVAMQKILERWDAS